MHTGIVTAVADESDWAWGKGVLFEGGSAVFHDDFFSDGDILLNRIQKLARVINA